MEYQHFCIYKFLRICKKGLTKMMQFLFCVLMKYEKYNEIKIKT